MKIAEEGSLTAAANVLGKPLPSVVRMLLAHAQLQETLGSLSVIADHLGYQSEAAFCRAFKRVFAVPPGSVRQIPQHIVGGGAMRDVSMR